MLIAVRNSFENVLTKTATAKGFCTKNSVLNATENEINMNSFLKTRLLICACSFVSIFSSSPVVLSARLKIVAMRMRLYLMRRIFDSLILLPRTGKNSISVSARSSKACHLARALSFRSFDNLYCMYARYAFRLRSAFSSLTYSSKRVVKSRFINSACALSICFCVSTTSAFSRNSFSRKKSRTDSVTNITDKHVKPSNIQYDASLKIDGSKPA